MKRWGLHALAVASLLVFATSACGSTGTSAPSPAVVELVIDSTIDFGEVSFEGWEMRVGPDGTSVTSTATQGNTEIAGESCDQISRFFPSATDCDIGDAIHYRSNPMTVAVAGDGTATLPMVFTVPVRFSVWAPTAADPLCMWGASGTIEPGVETATADVAVACQ